MSLWAKLKSAGPSGFGYGSTAEDVTRDIDLAGKTMLVTGCNSGIGYETLRVLALRGAHVFAAARTVDKARAACQGMAETTPVACELSEPEVVTACVETIVASGRKLDAIICNAAIMALPRLEQKYGYEMQFFTNHIGHFLLVTGLLDCLADDGRVVMLSSAAHKSAPRQGIEFDNLSGENGYSGWRAYGHAKLANLLFARELSRRLQDSGKTANAVHPGVIQTNLARHMTPLARVALTIATPIALKTAAQGAATQVYVATHPSLAKVSGEYFADCNVTRSSVQGQDMEMAKKLWEVSEKIIAGLGDQASS